MMHCWRCLVKYPYHIVTSFDIIIISSLWWAVSRIHNSSDVCRKNRQGQGYGILTVSSKNQTLRRDTAETFHSSFLYFLLRYEM